MTNELVMFILQGLLGAFMLGMGIILNGLRKSLDDVNKDLKELNNAVLGQYIRRDESNGAWSIHRLETESKWAAQRTLDHELRSIIQNVMVDIAGIKGVPYNYQRPAPPEVVD